MAMDYRYLLDTNILSDLIKNPQGKVAAYITESGCERQCCTSVIVACELRYGAARKNSLALSNNIERILTSLPIIPLTAEASMVYGDLRVLLEKRGLPIGSNDLLIGAQALSLGQVLVSANTREFARIPKLALESWLD